MIQVWNSVAFRLSLMYGSFVVVTVALISAAIYIGTVGVLAHQADDKIASISEKLNGYAENHDLSQLASRVEQALNDGVDSDTEIYLLCNSQGYKLAGNIANCELPTSGLNTITDQTVMREGKSVSGRLLSKRLTGGATLIVGRDMFDVREISALSLRSIAVGGAIAVLLSALGAFFFRLQIERRIMAIRKAAKRIEDGDLSLRIPVSDDKDEFSRLANDLNRMLDRIEHLMDGVRHVSNTIAHNLRTPLGRTRGHLEQALRHPQQEQLEQAASQAISEVDGVISLLGKLLQLAEAEAGARRSSFQIMDLAAVLTGLQELYDAAAEDLECSLELKTNGNCQILGDRELLASAIANLLDNALKYAGRGAKIKISASRYGNKVELVVSDNGPGIPESEYHKVTQRYYRLQTNSEGYGIGLAIVSAIIKLHEGRLSFDNGHPGLIVRMHFAAAH